MRPRYPPPIIPSGIAGWGTWTFSLNRSWTRQRRVCGV